MMRKKSVIKMSLVSLLVVFAIAIIPHTTEAGLFNRQGTWKVQYEESLGGRDLLRYEECKWSIWKSECSSEGDGERRNEENYRL